MPLSSSAHVDTYCRDDLPPEGQWPEFTFELPELRRYPDRPCLLSRDGPTWTYAQLLQRSNRVARSLRDELGVVPGNRVSLRGPNTPWLIACWFGVLKVGAVAVTTVSLLHARELRDIHEIAQVSAAQPPTTCAQPPTTSRCSRSRLALPAGRGVDAFPPRRARDRRHLFATRPQAAQRRRVRRHAAASRGIRTWGAVGPTIGS